jgi:hypothetical protein
MRQWAGLTLLICKLHLLISCSTAWQVADQAGCSSCQGSITLQRMRVCTYSTCCLQQGIVFAWQHVCALEMHICNAFLRYHLACSSMHYYGWLHVVDSTAFCVAAAVPAARQLQWVKTAVAAAAASTAALGLLANLMRLYLACMCVGGSEHVDGKAVMRGSTCSLRSCSGAMCVQHA